MIAFKKISGDITNILKSRKIYSVIVFGSYAYGKAHEESDLDLLVILDKKGISSNYAEILKN